MRVQFLLDELIGVSKKYQVVYADCPWNYKDKALAGNRGAGCKYDVQDVNWIKSLPVKNIADDNCILFMWATFPNLQEALDVIKAWGFKYKTLGFSWVKTNKKSGTPFIGLGHYSRSNCEVCLIATKGKFKRVSKSVSSVIISPIRSHSQKPDETRDRIVQLCGDIPRVELFARESAPGWDSIGNGIDGRDIMEVLENWGMDNEIQNQL